MKHTRRTESGAGVALLVIPKYVKFGQMCLFIFENILKITHFTHFFETLRQHWATVMSNVQAIGQSTLRIAPLPRGLHHDAQPHLLKWG